jgi:hypothetical protein
MRTASCTKKRIQAFQKPYEPRDQKEFNSGAQLNTNQANSGNRGYQELRSFKMILVVSNTQGAK